MNTSGIVLGNGTQAREFQHSAQQKTPFRQENAIQDVRASKPKKSDFQMRGAGRGADCLPVLILNKLLKMLDAQNYQNAGNAIPTIADQRRRLLTELGFPARFAGEQ